MAKLQVLLLRARNLAAKDRNGLSDPFVRFQLGKAKAKSATVYKNLNPEWNEEFLFRVDDLQHDKLEVALWDEDFLGMADFLGHVSVPVADVLAAEGQNLPRTWYTLTHRGDRPRDYYISGEVELSFALWGALPYAPPSIDQPPFPASSFPRTGSVESCPPEAGMTERSLSSDSETFPFSDSGGFSGDDAATPRADGNGNPKAGGAAGGGPGGRQGAAHFSATKMFTSLRSLPDRLQTASRNKFSAAVTTSASEGAAVFNSVSSLAANGVVKGAASGISAASGIVKTASSQFTAVGAAAVHAFDAASSSGASDAEGGPPSSSGGAPGAALVAASWFETSLKDVASPGELPAAYEGGVVLDQGFACPAHELNAIIFKPESEFWQEFANVRKVSGLETGPWVQDAEGGAAGPIHRTMTYMTAPSALVKSVKATEEMQYTRADAGGYVVEACVSTPDVPYGNTFQTQMQFCIAAQKDGTSHLRVAFRPHFFQSTMMKSMIENGMRSGIKDTYVTFLQVLSKYATPVGTAASEKAPESSRRGSKLPLARLRDAALDFLVPCSCALFLVGLVAVPWHIAAPHGRGWGGEGLRRWGVDLPDTFLELLTAVLLTLSGERAILRIRLFFLSQLFSKGDAGKKASGEGWFVSITLVEGENIGGANLRDLADPYVVFTCNGKTRTSSVKLQSPKPKWNETLTFDAFEDVPSAMEVELFDYEGPFADADLLGRAEVDLLKQSKEGLSDVWVPLEGRKAALHGSRLHIRVQLTAQGGAAVPKIMAEISKETGRKTVTSAEKNVAFQRLFDLPEHEYLVNDFSCALKKSLLTQGRLFLSPRVLAFYANLFGKKTKFFLLWEDIEELKENAPSIASINRLLNPSVTVFVRKGKGGPEARLAAYGVDSQGRMKLRFQSFVRPSVAFRTISLLWRHRALPPEQQLLKVEEAQALLFPRSKSQAPQEQEDTAAFVGTEPPEVLVTTVNEVPVTVDQFLQVLRENQLMKKAHEAMGHLNMEASEWVAGDTGQQRNVKYALSRQHCCFGTSVSVVQLATRDMASDRPAWAQLEEVITLHDVPFGDHFNVEMKRQVRQKTAATSQLKVIVSIAWQKATDPATKEKIKKDVSAHYKAQSQTIMAVIVREVVSAAQ